MKYGHEYAQLLASEGFPEEWISSAISYRLLKKAIKKVQQELSALGLHASTLQHMQSEFGVETPGERSNKPFVPELWVAIDSVSGEFLDAHLTNETKQYFLWLAQNNNKQWSALDSTGRHAGQISHASDGSSISDHEQYNAMVRKSLTEKGAQWANVHLSAAAKFFDLLDPKLAQLDMIQHAEGKRLESQIVELGTTVTALTEPAASKRGKFKARPDVTLWREILALYVQHAIFFSPYERDRGSRSFNQARSHLERFSKDLVDQGLVQKFKDKSSRIAFDQFATINLDILKAMRFQELNTEAVRKILKKFDKRTALGATKAYKDHAHSGLFAKSVATDMCAAMSQQVVTIVPQLDDHSCPVCYTIAWRPIRLECCNTVFCIRCMIELQKSASKCPMCRSTSVITADSGSIDQQQANYLIRYFPAEVKEKQKANELAVAIDKYGPEFNKGPCCIM
jgi:E3 ubiquitin-protein ligase BAH